MNKLNRNLVEKLKREKKLVWRFIFRLSYFTQKKNWGSCFNTKFLLNKKVVKKWIIFCFVYICSIMDSLIVVDIKHEKIYPTEI